MPRLELHDSMKNSHKFYELTIVELPNTQWCVRCAWGRIGATPTVKELGPLSLHAAYVEYDRLYNSKRNKGYTVVRQIAGQQTNGRDVVKLTAIVETKPVPEVAKKPKQPENPINARVANLMKSL